MLYFLKMKTLFVVKYPEKIITREVNQGCEWVINGEGVATTTMITTPAAVLEYNNVFSSVFLDVPRGCCSQVSVKNISTQAINVQNANLIVERVA